MAQIMNQVSRQIFRNLTNFSTRKIFCTTNTRFISTTRASLVDRLYTQKHEWIEINGTVGTVGITNYAQDALGDVVYAQLPEIGDQIKQEEEVGALESVKAASEILSPISGKVIEINTALESKPGLINSACYTDGWLFKVEIENKDELTSLLDEKLYEDFLKSDQN